ncbi:Tox-REase-5 domain-containing protein [Melittangium boletus]|uniref:Tox-REase-5 domain-containing protein n=1 Tax=Melittangium boletus TaxID=83453 RepID=UPI003DA28E88
MQEAGGLGADARHPAGATLSPARARGLLAQLVRSPVTRKSFAPRRVLSWLLSEVGAGDERVEYGDLVWRAERFGPLVVVRPDGYLVTALTGTPVQRLGSLRLVEREWRVGQLVVGEFYFSRGGVFFPVTRALRRGDGPPLGELGLGRDWLTAALDGAGEALGEMTVALGQSVLHPIRTLEDLAQLPTAVALLLSSSPEYFARYGGMSREDQIREAARLSTHVLLLFGGAEATWGRLGGWGTGVTLTARGELAWAEGVALQGATGVVGLPSVLHMAGHGRGHADGSGSPREETPSAGTPAKVPGKWTYKKPTTRSKDSLDYQEQVTGRPAWWVYMVGEVEFDGLLGTELLEAKGPGYCSFFNADGTPKYWYTNSGKFKEMMDQARAQSETARRIGLPLTWYVADAKVAEFLRLEFKRRGLSNTTVRHVPPTR